MCNKVSQWHFEIQSSILRGIEAAAALDLEVVDLKLKM